MKTQLKALVVGAALALTAASAADAQPWTSIARREVNLDHRIDVGEQRRVDPPVLGIPAVLVSGAGRPAHQPEDVVPVGAQRGYQVGSDQP
jgi:hypothetical protein